MGSGTILIVDDEPQIRRVVRHAVEAFGTTLEAATGREGLDLAAARRPDLVVLDLGLPDMAGASVCAEIRRWSSVPVVVLSARHSDHEKIALFEAGADDYVTKPFSPEEFQARVRAHLRRARLPPGAGDGGPVEVEGLTIDLARKWIGREGQDVRLTPTEWDLLRALMAHPGKALTHAELFRTVWGRSDGDAQANLRVHVANLRRKLERDAVRPRLIVTEPGIGYRFRPVG
jgi:two-component system KDP operon response regulator KdpE